ncbi:MAG: tetratricopeptide repeat protein [Leptolyngbyaceae bacterium]|nr:tetratricopeptide repeat protein [Leptolyngbyaceae bacterium]
MSNPSPSSLKQYIHRYGQLVCCLSAFWGAIPALAQAQAVPPSQAAPTQQSAEKNFEQGDMTRAIQQWSRDIKNGNDVVRALFNRSQTYILLKQYEFAVQDLNQLIQLQGDRTPADVFVVRGIALSEMNQIPAAIQSFNQAEKLQPSALVYSNRALAYQRNAQFPQALEDLKKAIQLAPTPFNRLNLANLQLQLGQFTQVVEGMNQLLTQEKSFFPAYLTRGIAYYNLGQYETAVRDFLFSLTILPDQPEAYYYTGLSFAKLNRRDDASQNLIRAADIYLRQNQPNSYHQVLKKMNELALQ